jgi:hypothetical protein
MVKMGYAQKAFWKEAKTSPKKIDELFANFKVNTKRLPSM